MQIDGVPGDIKPVKTKGQVLAETGKAAPAEVGEADVDVVAQVITGDLPTEEMLEEGPATEEIDPIAALEAMAGESKKKDKGAK